MRVRDSAKNCPPICFVQAAAHKHDLENKVKKTFTYVSEQEGEDFTLEANLKDAVEDLALIQKALDAYAKAGTKKVRRELRGLIKDLFYSVKAEIFDAEDQAMKLTEEK